MAGGILGYLLVAAPVVLAFWSIFRVSGGDVEIQLLLLRTLNVPAIVYAAILPSLAGILAGVMALITRRYMTEIGSNTQRTAILQRIVTLGVAAGVLFLPAVHGVLIAAMFLWESYASRLAERVDDRNRNFLHEVRNVAVAGMIILGLGMGVANASIWLPPEKVQTRQDPAGFMAYVLESGDHDLTVLREGPRPAIFRQDDVVARTLCTRMDHTGPVKRFIDRVHTEPLLTLITGKSLLGVGKPGTPSPYAQCPQS
ncbi:hypothetical protein ACFYOT_37955 [Saccharothrix saharensis]|uniref:hypothetical protein n=1 Tax=Saccharothrix saharensis TaxID=571190 RepID=UPI0036AC8A6C